MEKKQFELERLVRENVLSLKPYTSARDEYKDVDGEMIFMDANENPFESEVNRYPDPQQRDVKSILAAQKGIKPSQLLLGNGSDEVLDLLFRAFCEPHVDNIITLPPTYGMYKVLAGINAIENKEVLLNDIFEPNVSEILKTQNSQSKLLFLCSPNNPTGNSFSETSITELLEKFNGIVVIDEAYIDFAENESWIYKLAQYPNLVVTQTLSKAYGMAGIRLGICFASRAIIEVLNKIKPPYNVNELTQQKAFERLVNIEDVIEEVDEIIEQKIELTTALKTISFVTDVYTSNANFVLIKVDDASRRYKQLIERRIVVRNRSTQPLCKNTLRITVGTAEENEQLIEVLKKL